MQHLLLIYFDDTAEQRPADDCRAPSPGADARSTWLRETETPGVRLLAGARTCKFEVREVSNDGLGGSASHT